jgi:hypothetical protein
MRRLIIVIPRAFAALVAGTVFPAALHAQQAITGRAAFACYSQQKPGVRRKIIVAGCASLGPPCWYRSRKRWTSLYVSDDGSRSVWRGSYSRKE